MSASAAIAFDSSEEVALLANAIAGTSATRRASFLIAQEWRSVARSAGGGGARAGPPVCEARLRPLRRRDPLAARPAVEDEREEGHARGPECPGGEQEMLDEKSRQPLPDDLRNRRQGLVQAQNDALLLASRLLGDEAGERRPDQAVADGGEGRGDEQQGDSVGEAEERISYRSHREPERDEVHFPELVYALRSDRPLDQDAEDPRIGEHVAHLLGAEEESLPALREERETAHEDGEGEGVEEELPEQAAQDRTAEIRSVDLPIEDPQAPSAGRDGRYLFGGERRRGLGGVGDCGYRRQQERGSENAHEGEPGRAEDRNVVPVVRRQVARRARSEHESDSECDSDQPESAHALLGRRDVGDVGLRDGEVAGGEPVDRAREEDHPQVVRGSENEEPGERA